MPTTYTVCEDQPKTGRWDVEIRTFDTRHEAEKFMERYTRAERDGLSDDCRPMLRYDGTGEYVD